MKTTTYLLIGLAAVLPLWPQSAGQVEPNGGKWKTWLLSSGSQFRLPPPPTAAATVDELAWLKSVQASLDDTDRAQVAYWDQGSPSYHWVQWLEQRILSAGVNTPNATRQMALLNVAIYDSMVGAWDSKYTFNRPLPAQMDTSFHPLVSSPNVPAYPNEFAVAAGAAAAVLSYLYPADAVSLQNLAQEAGRSRLFRLSHRLLRRAASRRRSRATGDSTSEVGWLECSVDGNGADRTRHVDGDQSGLSPLWHVGHVGIDRRESV